jgi:ribosomal protein S18 acetylase RimI-like enzyme
MMLRIATMKEESTISSWLRDKKDCKFTTGKEVYSNEMYKEWTNATDQHGFFLIKDNEPLAYGEIWVDDDEGDLELAHLIVHPSHRGKGLGKELISQLLLKCKSYSYPEIFMRIVPENSRALRCYKAAGFKIVPSLRKSYGARWIWMRKNNAPEK